MFPSRHEMDKNFFQCHGFHLHPYWMQLLQPSFNCSTPRINGQIAFVAIGLLGQYFLDIDFIGNGSIEANMDFYGLVFHLFEILFQDELPIVKNTKMVDDSFQFVNQMGREQDGGPLIQDFPDDALEKILAGRDIHAGGGVVQDQKPRLCGQRYDQSQLEFHATGKIFDLEILVQIESIEQFVGFILVPVGIKRGIEGHQLFDRHPTEKNGFFRDVSDFFFIIWTVEFDLSPLVEDLAFIDRDDAHDHPDQSGLSLSVFAEKPVYLTLLEVQAEIFENLFSSEAFREIYGLQYLTHFFLLSLWSFEAHSAYPQRIF